jgi:hypothetical protein
MESFFDHLPFFGDNYMTADTFEIALDSTPRPKQMPCPNCCAKLTRKTVMNEESPNVDRPYIFCQACSSTGQICFWFIDLGECACGSPIYQATSKKGTNVGRRFEACSKGCKGSFQWLDSEEVNVVNEGYPD